MEVPTYNSLEVRWFVPGVLPEATSERFATEGELPAQERRTDSYWMVPRHDVGVKRRNGGPVEMKVRRSARPWRTPWATTVHVEQWSKWRPHRLDPDDTTGQWVDIDKLLLTRTFSLTGVEVGGPVDGERARCEVELGSIQSAGGSWWTLAFEVTGPSRLQPVVLSRVLERFHGRIADEVTDATNAGYPEWLACALCVSGCR